MQTGTTLKYSCQTKSKTPFAQLWKLNVRGNLETKSGYQLPKGRDLFYSTFLVNQFVKYCLSLLSAVNISISCYFPNFHLSAD